MAIEMHNHWVQEYIAITKAKFGIELNADDARRNVASLLLTTYNIYKPIPKHQNSTEESYEKCKL